MSNFKKQYVVNRHLINIGDKFTVGDGFFKYSQSKTKGGEYKLEMVDTVPFFSYLFQKLKPQD